MDESKMLAKKEVLKEIMDMMDAAVSNKLKAKSPKFMSLEVEAEAEPEQERTPEDIIKEKLMGESKKEPQENSEESSDDLERLKELYARLK